tara:strand:+ start:44 stop:457 length:414 start_codon:yes stop_codon:yes gene_type:complete
MATLEGFMKPKITLTITALIGLVFSSVMFIAPEFVTREQFPNAEGQGFTDLITLRYAIASLILALVIITYHLRNIEGRAFQAHVMRGYTLAFSVVCVTNLILQVLGKISAVPPTVATGLIAILSFVSWRNLAKISET